MIVPSSCPWRCLQCLGLPVSSFQILCYGVAVTEQFLLKPFCRFDKQWQELKIAVCAVRVAWLFQSTLPLTEELSGLNVSGCLFFFNHFCESSSEVARKHLWKTNLHVCGLDPSSWIPENCRHWDQTGLGLSMMLRVQSCRLVLKQPQRTPVPPAESKESLSPAAFPTLGMVSAAGGWEVWMQKVPLAFWAPAASPSPQ